MKRKIALGLAAATVLSLGGGGAYAYAKTTPAAYVSVDINPSVELGVNSFGKVVSAQAYNEDGQKVLEGTNLVNFDAEKAVSTVITNAISDGYIKEDATTTAAVAVEITTSTDKEKMATELDESLKEAANKTLEDNNVNAEAESENVALARRDEARQLGITPGKLNLIQKLQALDPTINVEDYKTSSVKDIQKKIKELRKMNKNDTSNDESTTTDTNNDKDINNTTSTDASTSGDVTTQESAGNQTDNSNDEKDENGSINKKKEDSGIEDDKEKNNSVKQEKQSDNGKLNSENKNSNKGKK